MDIMNEKMRIHVAKHLHDRDDLEREGRDAGLVAGQEHLAANMADEVYRHAVEGGFNTLVFCASTKTRTIETAQMVEHSLRDKPIKLHIILETDPNLREIDQGAFILPPGYKAGDSFEGLKIAWKIFSAETFNERDPSKDNLDYHFGDPLRQEDGTFKYPELNNYFSERGESYRDILLRLYAQVVKLSDNMQRFGDKVRPVVFTHGQPYQIFRDLAEAADKVETEGLTFSPGGLARICQTLYMDRVRREGTIPPGKLDLVAIEHVCNPKMIELLRREMTYLENGRAAV